MDFASWVHQPAKNGFIQPKNIEEIMQFFLRTLALGFFVGSTLFGSFAIAGMQEANDALEHKDYMKAYQEYLVLAMQDNAEAQNNLGALFAKGQGVPKNDQEAVKWYSLAAEQGNATAQTNLGSMYINGRGVPKNYQEAIQRYRLAASQNNAEAQYYLGMMYDNGLGVQKNYQEAIQWYRLAASQKNAEAQNSLGIKYAMGEGVSKNLMLAYVLFNLSAAQGDKMAIQNREKLNLSPQQISIAQNISSDINASKNFLKIFDLYSKYPVKK